MRKTIIVATGLVLTALLIVAAVANINTDTKVQQLKLETTDLKIETQQETIKALEVELNEAKGDSKKLKEVQDKLDKVEAENKALQAKKAEDQRIAAEQAQNAVMAEAVQPQTAPVGNIEQIVRDAANKFGIDPDLFVRIAMCESTMNPNSVNYGYSENGNPSGLFQHLSGYWPARAAAHGYAGASVFDPVANANVTAAMWVSGSSGLWECQ